MIKKIKIVTVCFFVCLLMMVFCESQKSEWQGRIYESNNVKIIRNPKRPIYEKDVFDLKLELTIGGKEAQKPACMFTNIKEMAVDNQENIFVLDSHQKSIKKFNPQGNYLCSIGRLGQNPGEYGFPWDICLLKNRLSVLDIIYRKLVFYSLGGNFIKQINTVKKGQPIDIKVNSNQEYIIYTLLHRQNRSYELSKFDHDFKKIDVIDSFEREKIPILESLSPDIQWCLTTKDEIIWGYSDRYEIKIQNSKGIFTKRILRNYDPVPVNKQEYAEKINKKFGGKPPGPQFQQKLPKFHPAFHSILTDDIGRIFIGVFPKSDEKGMPYDILDPDGRYLAKMELPFTPYLFKKGKLYSLEKDSGGYLLIKRYQIKWKNL